jgi:signal transduction histidine kinase
VLEPAFGAEAPVVVGPLPDGSTWLALGLRPERDDRWCVALGRRSTWTAAERRSLAELRPCLELVLGRAVLHAHLAEAREREALAAEEHERFLNVISHELRNPLAPILMWTSTLRRLRPDDAEVLRAAQAIAQSVNVERRLIEELLDLSRLERGVLEIVLETIDLRDVVRQALEPYRARIAEAQLTLADDLPAKDVRVQADSRRIGEVLGALVENAIKFTPHGGQIRVALAQRNGRVELVVSDTGPGIPADVLPRLFTPFVQGKNARGGLGLGLAIAQRVLVPHHGTIEATNAGDGGARFVVTLPETAA